MSRLGILIQSIKVVLIEIESPFFILHTRTKCDKIWIRQTTD